MILRYAAYGSNLHPVRLQQRTPSARLLGTAFHPDYSLRFHKRSVDGSGKCGIFKGSTGVHFAIFELSNEDKQILDEIEGVGRGYDIVEIELEGFGPCYTYAPSHDHIDAGLSPYKWYLEMVLHGCTAHEFPDDYVDRITATSAVRDPLDDRRTSNQAIVDLLRK